MYGLRPDIERPYKLMSFGPALASGAFGVPGGLSRAEQMAVREARRVAADDRAERKRQARRLRETAKAVWYDQETLQKCGVHAVGTHECAGERGVTLMLGDHGARWAGLASCNSVWMCPVCAARIAAQRREHVMALVRDHQRMGGTCVFLTLTQGHQKGHGLADTVAPLTDRWSKLRRRRKMKDIEEALCSRGGIRALEITDGKHGWHPHLHFLLFLGKGGKPLLYNTLKENLDALVNLWIEVTLSEGIPCTERAQDWQICDDAEGAGEYVVKWGIGAELTHTHLKDGKAGGGRTPWQMLRDFQETGWPNDAARLREYGATMKGRRQLTTWGEISLTELPPAEEEEDRRAMSGEGSETPLLWIPAWAFDDLRRRRLLETVERSAEVGGFEAAYNALRFLGCDAIHPPENVTLSFGHGRSRKKSETNNLSPPE